MSFSYTSRNAQYTIYFLRSCKTGTDRQTDRDGGVDMLINLIFNRLIFNLLLDVFAKQHIRNLTYFKLCLSDMDNLHCLLK